MAGVFALVFAQSQLLVRLLNARAKEWWTYCFLTEMLDLPKMSVQVSPTLVVHPKEPFLSHDKNPVESVSTIEADSLWREKEVFLYE